MSDYDVAKIITDFIMYLLYKPELDCLPLLQGAKTSVNIEHVEIERARALLRHGVYVLHKELSSPLVNRVLNMELGTVHYHSGIVLPYKPFVMLTCRERAPVFDSVFDWYVVTST